MGDNGKKFEQELEELELVVRQIDSGELTLEESISAFERGVALVRALTQKLDEVERRVEVLIRGARGELKSAEYQGEGIPQDNGGKDKEDEDIPF
jgi:exodeoxyribonuclease VII small subunit